MHLLRLLAVTGMTVALATTSQLVAQKGRTGKQAMEPIRSLHGSLMLAGNGAVPDSALAVFVQLCGGLDVDVAVVSTRGKSKLAKRLRQHGVGRVVAVGKQARGDASLALSMLGVSGVWFEDAAEPLQQDPLFRALLRNVLKLGGAVGGNGAGALALASPACGLLQRARVELLKAEDPDGIVDTVEKGLKAGDGLVGWQIPKATALLVHHGRRVCAIGSGAVVASVAGRNPWPSRRAVIPGQDVRELGDLAYEVDLLGWARSARDRTGPIFPSTKVAKPKLSRGTVVLSGGGGVQSPTWRRFIEAAGGKGSVIVCIPTSGHDRGDDRPSSYGARGLREHGCTNVTVLHTRDPDQANDGAQFLSVLRKATGVWIDGGRTYQFMDAYEGTTVQKLIGDVLQRGGAVGGSSAGCQVLGEFLVRGDPRGNKRLVFDGYTRGLAMLPGVVLDAHFTSRKRLDPFSMLVKMHPQLLGIGVDGGTALVVEGSVGEVMGQKAVSFIDARGGGKPVVLRAGERYDLVKRRAVR